MSPVRECSPEKAIIDRWWPQYTHRINNAHIG